MKKSWQLFLILTIVVVGTFLFNEKVLAFRFSQLINTTRWHFTSSPGNSTGQTFVSPVSGYPLSVETTIVGGTKDQICHFVLYQVGINNPWGSAIKTVKKNETNDYIFSWSTSTRPWELIKGDSFYLSFSCATSDYELFGSKTSVIDGIFGHYSDQGLTFVSSTPIADLYFSMLIEPNDYDPYVPLTLEFATTPTTTCDFDYWHVKGTIDPTLYDIFVATEAKTVIMWGTSPNYYDYQDIFWGFQEDKFDLKIKKSTAIGSGWTIFAQAFLCSGFNSEEECYFTKEDGSYNQENMIASSNVWEFEIDTIENCNKKFETPGLSYPTATSTEMINNWTCDETDGFFANSMCRMFQYLFQPNSESLKRFVNIKQLIESKPPFGYFAIYKDQFDTMSTSTSSTLESDLGTDYNNYSGGIQDISIFDKLYTGITWLLWFLFGFWVLNRFRHFSLHG